VTELFRLRVHRSRQARRYPKEREMSVPHRATVALLATALLPVIAALGLPVPAHAAVATCRGVKATIVGTPAPERIHGTPGRDVIAGLGGDDTIFAAGGNDLVCGGDGADHLYGGPGNDRLFGELDRFIPPEDEDVASRLGDTLAGGRGDDRMFAGVDHRRAPEDTLPDTISWEASAHGVHIDLRTGVAHGEGSDTFAGGRFIVVGSSHGDVVEGSSRPDRINTGTGSDVVRARGGADIINVDGPEGGPGGDADRVWGGDDNDRISARHGQDRLAGGAGNDTIESFGASNDILTGGDGNDLIEAEIGHSRGPQRWDGGPGADGIRVATDEINPDAAASTSTWDMATGAMTATVDHPISLSVSRFEVGLFASSSFTSDTAWVVTGTAGDDSIEGQASQTAPLHFDGLAGNDSFKGTNGDDVFNGGPGDDHSQGMLGGDDTCTSVETFDLADCEHIS
jgi:Ca2+-binding RTX toxin-like protein